MPGPSIPTLVKALESDLSSPGLNGHKIEGAIDVIKGFSREAVAAGAAELGPEAVTGTEVGAEALVGITASEIIVILIAISLIWVGLRKIGDAITGKLPGWIVGPLAWTIDHLLPGGVQSLDWMSAIIVELLKDTLRSWVQWLNYLLPHAEVIKHVMGTSGHGTVTNNALQRQVQTLVQWNTKLQTELDQLNHSVYHHPVSRSTTAPSLETQVIELGREIDVLHQDYVDLSRLTATNSSTLSLVQHELHRLSTELTGTRSTVTSWPEVERSLRDTMQRVEQVQQDIMHDVRRNTHTLTQLSPLVTLTDPGQPGIDTLRKLEDNPCQCPKLFDIPNELGAFLGLYEFMTNG